jgi:hypothetical protein
MFTNGFGKYVCDGDRITCEVDGFTFTATIVDDSDSGPPWENDGGHGPVSEWTNREKRPGERTLIEERGSRRFYDFAGAVEMARKDGWGLPEAERKEGMTPGQIAAAAAEHDFKVLKAWCNDDWHYVGVRLSVSLDSHELSDHAASLWCVEANYPDSDNGYLTQVANELLPEALEVARKEGAEFIVESLAASLASYVTVDDAMIVERKQFLRMVAARILADIAEPAESVP